MYQVDGSLRSPYDPALSALIHEATFRELVGGALVSKICLVRDFGKCAVHDDRACRGYGSHGVADADSFRLPD